MTRQRKTHLFILALVPILVFTAVRCADTSATAPYLAPVVIKEPIEAKLARLHSENDWIGAFHNEALAHVLTVLQRVPAKSRNGRAVCEAARAAYADFHKARRGSPVPAVVDAEFAGFCATRGSARSARLASLSLPGRISRVEVSADAQALLDQIPAAIDASTSYEDLTARINSIEAGAASTLSYDEASAVVAVGSVALSSAAYWGDNITSWVPFTNTPDYSVLFAAIGPTTDGFSSLQRGAAGASSATGPSADWGSIWNDAKAAAKRAAVGDARSAIKAVIGTSLLEGPIIYEVVVSAAAAGSIMAVLYI